MPTILFRVSSNKLSPLCSKQPIIYDCNVRVIESNASYYFLKYINLLLYMIYPKVQKLSACLIHNLLTEFQHNAIILESCKRLQESEIVS